MRAAGIIPVCNGSKCALHCRTHSQDMTPPKPAQAAKVACSLVKHAGRSRLSQAGPPQPGMHTQTPTDRSQYPAPRCSLHVDEQGGKGANHVDSLWPLRCDGPWPWPVRPIGAFTEDVESGISRGALRSPEQTVSLHPPHESSSSARVAREELDVRAHEATSHHGLHCGSQRARRLRSSSLAWCLSKAPPTSRHSFAVVRLHIRSERRGSKFFIMLAHA
mmetsp:Transcript_35791/g.86922  ORF Transcript_35791/g.86922 Transcript_35791/m.86922 type:complete len:219 (-) Transcript_35791:139-795(-)